MTDKKVTKKSAAKKVAKSATKSATVLVLRTCDRNRQGYNGFQWPAEGPVACTDWDPKPECGNGLHGLLWGMGNSDLLNWNPDAIWLVVEVLATDIVNIDGSKVKFPAGNVVCCGDRKTATDYLVANSPANTACHGCYLIGGNNSRLMGGDYARVTGGNWATVTGGDGANVTGGNDATVTGGNCANVTGGDDATVTGGNYATVTGGDDATVTGGNWATVTGGDDATVTGGNWATVTGGYHANVTGGISATVTGGDYATVIGSEKSVLSLKYWDDYNDRYRTVVAYVGENGIEANTKYKLDAEHKFVKAE